MEFNSAEAEGSQSTSPSRKRLRLEEEPELDEVMIVRELWQSDPSPSGDATRDEDYYFSDGSCILRVEDTLFNVHRSIMSKDSSLFSSMFQLPQPSLEKSPEGASDDNPIILTGDTVAEFKNFLWALYALPHELMVVHSERSDFTQLMDIARISNKYSFRSLETWALDAISDAINRKPAPLFLTYPYVLSPADKSFSITPSGLQATELVRLAQTCNHERLLQTMITLIQQRIPTSILYACLGMNLADELDLRELRGAAYMAILKKGAIFSPATRGNGTAGGTGEQSEDDAEQQLMISPGQKLRLLCGYYRLSQIWEQLRRTPLSLEHAASCGATWHQQGCTQSWLEFWKEKTKSDVVLDLGLANVPGRLRAIGKEFDRWGTAPYMHHECRIAAKKKIQDKAKEVENALPDYFVEQALE